MLVFTTGCTNNANDIDKAIDTHDEKTDVPGTYNFNEAGFSSGENIAWPDYIPKSILALKGEISTIFADVNQIRIFINGVTREDLEDYIATMKKAGFEEEYILYVKSGFIDNSKDRKKCGEYDAVKFIKDNYEITVEQGEDVAVLDIDSSRFSEQEKEVVNQALNPVYTWPETLPFPQPDTSNIAKVEDAQDGSLRIVCSYDTDNHINQYVASLVALGYTKTEQSKNQDDIIIEAVLIKDDITVKINGNVNSKLDINIWLDDTYNAPDTMHPQVIDSKWPSTLPKTVPPFTLGTVDSALNVSGNQTIIMVTASNETAFDDYIDVLLQNGYVRANETEEHSYSNGEYEILLNRLMMSDMITITIDKLD